MTHQNHWNVTEKIPRFPADAEAPDDQLDVDVKFSPASPLEQENRVRESKPGHAKVIKSVLSTSQVDNSRYQLDGGQNHIGLNPLVQCLHHISITPMSTSTIGWSLQDLFLDVLQLADGSTKCLAGFHDRFEGQLRNYLNTAKSIYITHTNLCDCSSYSIITDFEDQWFTLLGGSKKHAKIHRIIPAVICLRLVLITFLYHIFSGCLTDKSSNYQGKHRVQKICCMKSASFFEVVPTETMRNSMVQLNGCNLKVHRKWCQFDVQ